MPSGVSSKRRGRALVLIVFLACVGVGCASSRGPGQKTRALGVVPVWPDPPEDPRIEYLSSIATPQDLGIKKSLFRKIREFFSGKTDDRIGQPYGIAVDAKQRIFVADSALGVVHFFDPTSGRYRALEGTKKVRFEHPVGVSLDDRGRLYVSDAGLAEVIGLEDNGKSFLRITEGLQRPAGLVFNPKNGLLYVADVLRHSILVFDQGGRLKNTFGGRGSGVGQFNYPTNVAVDRNGAIYVTDAMNFRVQIFDPDGTFVGTFGRPGDALGDLPCPKGISVDSEGHIYVVEGRYDVVNVFDRGGQLLLTFGGPGGAPGEFWLASGLFIDATDRIFVSDSYNSRIQVFRYLPEAR